MNTNAPFFAKNEIIQLNKNGIWTSDGTEITHEQTRKLFSKSIVKTKSGYQLHIRKEIFDIEVEDTAYFVERIDGSSMSGFNLLLNDESKQKLTPQTLKYTPGRLTCQIKTKANQLEDAKFLHIAYFDLLKNIEEDDRCYFLTIENKKTSLLNK